MSIMKSSPSLVKPSAHFSEEGAPHRNKVVTGKKREKIELLFQFILYQKANWQRDITSRAYFCYN